MKVLSNHITWKKYKGKVLKSRKILDAFFGKNNNTRNLQVDEEVINKIINKSHKNSPEIGEIRKIHHKENKDQYINHNII